MHASRHRKRIWIGAGIGVVLAVGLHIWYLNMASSGMDPEGLAFNSLMLGMLLGFPTNILLGLLLDYAMDFGIGGPGVTDYYGSLLGIVVNWGVLFWISGKLHRRLLPH